MYDLIKNKNGQFVIMKDGEAFCTFGKSIDFEEALRVLNLLRYV